MWGSLDFLYLRHLTQTGRPLMASALADLGDLTPQLFAPTGKEGDAPEARRPAIVTWAYQGIWSGIIGNDRSQQPGFKIARAFTEADACRARPAGAGQGWQQGSLKRSHPELAGSEQVGLQPFLQLRCCALPTSLVAHSQRTKWAMTGYL